MTDALPNPPGRYVQVRGTRLHVDERGPADAPALLYIHGGPGQGCFDFMAYQGDRLAKELRLIGVDQRGVLFSDPLPDGATLTEDDLVDDFEALREALGIVRWAILGHSFGGRLALRYAARQPDTVSAAIFDCPPWDHTHALRTMLEAALPLLDELRLTEAAQRARAMLADPPPPSYSTWRQRLEIIGALGERRNELYIKRADLAHRPFPSEDLDEDVQSRGMRHSQAVSRTDAFSESLLPKLRDLDLPALLIKGAADPVTSGTEIDRFRTDVRDGRVEIFEESGHFAQFEEPGRYADLVRAFLR